MFAWFNNIKTIVMAVIGALIAGYVVSENIRRKQAEAKLLKVERGIAEANVKLVKKQAEIKTETREVEIATQRQIIKDLKDNKKEVEKELKTAQASTMATAKKNVGKSGAVDLSKLEPVDIKS